MNKDFFKQNRLQYLDSIDDNSMTILFSGFNKHLSADQDYIFEPNRNFFYMTGIKQASVYLVLIKRNNGYEEYLFTNANNEMHTKWYGPYLTKEEEKEISGVEKVLYLESFNDFIFSSFNSTRQGSKILKTLYLDLERKNTPFFTTEALEFSKSFKEKYPEVVIQNAYTKIIYQRMFKKEEEIKEIKKAIATTKFALENVLDNLEVGLYEYQLESFFDQAIKYDGQKTTSFTTICGSGKNGAILHYQTNNSIIKDGDLVLMDLGCKGENYYISDITRTYPANGRYFGFNKKVYEAVLRVNKKCINFLKPGITWGEYNNYASKLLADECIALGLIENEKDLHKCYWHSIGHFIGLDTHDVGLYDVVLSEGMVLTVEPGIYVYDKNVGVRIEDNVLITKDGCINLSSDIIKEIEDIEKHLNNE